jgi:hypothetical protein
MQLVNANIGAAGLNLATSSAEPRIVQHAFYRYTLSDENQTNRFLHFKTNVPRGNNQMIMIEAVGYNYGSAQPIRCSWMFYSYSGDNNFYNTGLANLYNGIVPAGVYLSTDNFVCLSTTAKNVYFIGMVFNAYQANSDHGGIINQQIQITNAVATTSAGNQF